MKSTTHRWLVLPCILMLLNVQASAEIWVVESLDWLVDSSSAIARYRVTQADTQTNAIPCPRPTWLNFNLKGKLATPLKGQPPEEVAFKYHAQGSRSNTPPQIDRHFEFLVFFIPDEQKKPVVRTSLCLTVPNVSFFMSVAFARDFSVLKTGQEIEDAVSKRIQLGRSVSVADPEKHANVFTPPGNGSLRLEVPWNTDADHALCSGSVNFMVVPADEESREQLLHLMTSRDAWTRARAIRRLAAFPGKDTERLLRDLLQDETTVTFQRTVGKNPPTTVTARIIQQAAYEALKQLGVEVAKPSGLDENSSTRLLL